MCLNLAKIGPTSPQTTSIIIFIRYRKKCRGVGAPACASSERGSIFRAGVQANYAEGGGRAQQKWLLSIRVSLLTLSYFNQRRCKLPARPRPSPDHIHNGHATVKLLRASLGSSFSLSWKLNSPTTTSSSTPGRCLSAWCMLVWTFRSRIHYHLVVIKKNNKMYSGAKREPLRTRKAKFRECF